MKLEFDLLKAFDLPNPLEGDSYKKLKASLLAIMQASKDRLFDSGHDPDGNTWAPLSSLSKAKRDAKNKKSGQKNSKFSGTHKVLNDTGALRNSLGVAKAKGAIGTTDGDEVVLGSNLEYAAIHNYGGTIVPKNGKVLAFPGLGGATILAKKVVIPARPFMGIGAQDTADIDEKIQAVLAKAYK